MQAASVPRFTINSKYVLSYGIDVFLGDGRLMKEKSYDRKRLLQGDGTFIRDARLAKIGVFAGRRAQTGAG